MKVLFLTFIPSPYRLSFFEELSKNCDLTVLFERENSKFREGKWNNYQFNGYKGVIMKGITTRLQDRLCLECIKYVCNRNYDVVILSNPFSPTGFLASLLMRLLKIPYVVECDGAFPKHQVNWRTRIKGLVLKPAKLCLSTSKLTDDYFMECGVKMEQIFRYPFTSLYNKDIIEVPLTQTEKGEKRISLNLPNTFSVVTIGRFVEGKGFDLLIRVAQFFPDATFYFVGGKATEEYNYLIESLNIKNVVFVDFMPKDKLFDFLKCCDTFVLPTKSDTWGLVVNEAMACGLPIISTDMCIAATELIKKGLNGYIVQVDDINQLRDKLALLMKDESLVESMGLKSLEFIRKYTFETMSCAHLKAFDLFQGGKHEKN